MVSEARVAHKRSPPRSFSHVGRSIQPRFSPRRRSSASATVPSMRIRRRNTPYEHTIRSTHSHTITHAKTNTNSHPRQAIYRRVITSGCENPYIAGRVTTNTHTATRQSGPIVFTTAVYILITQGWLPCAQSSSNIVSGKADRSAQLI